MPEKKEDHVNFTHKYWLKITYNLLIKAFSVPLLFLQSFQVKYYKNRPIFVCQMYNHFLIISFKLLSQYKNLQNNQFSIFELFIQEINT